MIFVEFAAICKEEGFKEIRTITVLEEKYGVPPDTYILNELYCGDDSCDCRRVMFSIRAENSQETLATVAWGWENKTFYKKWIGGHIDSDLLDELKGPALNDGTYQCEFADGLLELVKEQLSDSSFTQIIKKHYSETRKKVKEKDKKEKQVEIREIREEEQYNSYEKPKRNEPCFCGSGKKYKKCCLWD